MSLRTLREGSHYRKAYKRLSKVPTPQVQQWAMASVWATQAGLEGYEQTGDPGALDELRRAVTGLLAAVDVLLDSAP